MVLTPKVSTSLAVAIAGLLVACDGSPTSFSEAAVAPAEANMLRAIEMEGAGWSIVSCPPAPAREVTGLIGPEGGVLTMGPYTLRVPAGAFTTPTTLRLWSPPGARLIVQVEAVGAGHTMPGEPVELTIRYGECPRQDIARRSLRLVQLHAGTSIIAVGDDVETDGEAFTVTTRLFSTFAVAY